MADWTPEDDELCERLWKAGRSAGTIAKRLGRSRGAISGRVDRQGWKRGEPATPRQLHGAAAQGAWTDAQREYLFLHWRQQPDDELAEAISELGPERTRLAVEQFRQNNGLKRPRGFEAGGTGTRDAKTEQPWPYLKGTEEEREREYLKRLFEGLAEENRRIAARRALAQQEAA